MVFNKILIAIDSSEYALNAARQGLELSDRLNAKPALIFVLDKSQAMGNIDSGILPAESMKKLKKEAEQTLDKLAKMYKGKELVKFMPTGDPAEEIIKTAIFWEADILVLGTHGRTGLKHLLMGSVAEHVIRRSKKAVLVIPLK